MSAGVGVPRIIITIPNYGPSAPSALPYDDLKVIRAPCSDLVDEGQEVILISHSHNGVPVRQAVCGLQRSIRKSEGKDGGIIRVMFVAFLIPEGVSTFRVVNGRPPPPWATRDGDIWTPNRDVCRAEFFQDMAPSEQERWADGLLIAKHNTVTTPVWRAYWDLDVAKTYVVTARDVAMPEAQQRAMMKPLWDQAWNIDEIESGHAPFLSSIGDYGEDFRKVRRGFTRRSE